MEIETETLGEFFGAHLKAERLEQLAFETIPHKHLASDRNLFDQKWFDYRFMHPAHATYYFADCYRRVHRRMWERYVDRATAHYSRAIKELDFMKAKGALRTGIWVARQTADARRVPYEIYLELAFTKALSWQRKFLPLPSQLYSQQIIDAVDAGWDERTKAKMYVAADPRYRLDRWEGTPQQLSHESWVATQIARRTPGSRAVLLAQYLWKDPVMREDYAITRFGEEEIERARAAM